MKYVIQLTKKQIKALNKAAIACSDASVLEALGKAEPADEVLCLSGVEWKVLYNMLIEIMCGRTVLKLIFPRKPDREAAYRVWKKLGGGSLGNAQ